MTEEISAGATTPAPADTSAPTNTAAPAVSTDAPITTVLTTDAAVTTEKTTTTESTSTEKPTDGEAKLEGKDPAAEKPIEYEEFKLPEGHEVDGDLMSEFQELAKEAKLPQEQAQKLLDTYTKAIQKVADSTWNVWKETNEKWAKTVKDDAEIGGAKFDTMTSTVDKAIKGIFNAAEEKSFKEGLIATGAGNHPEIIRGLFRLASQVTEGGHVSGRPSSAPKSAAQTLYPTQKST